MQVKDNQPTLHGEIQQVAAQAKPDEAVTSKTKARGRSEKRTVSVFYPDQNQISSEWKPHVKTVIQVERETYHRHTKSGLLRRSSETAFYVANADIGAAHAADAIRSHWKIENTSHHTRDVTLKEDQSRIRFKPRLFARIRSFAFNILKANKAETLSQDRYSAALAGLDDLIKMIGCPQR